MSSLRSARSGIIALILTWLSAPNETKHERPHKNMHTWTALPVSWAGYKFYNSSIRSFVSLFVCSIVHFFVRSFICSFVRSFVRAFNWSFIHSFVRTFVHSLLRSVFVRSFSRSLARSFVRSFVRSITCSFVRRSFIHSVIFGIIIFSLFYAINAIILMNKNT